MTDNGLLGEGEYPSHLASGLDIGPWKFYSEINRPEMREAELLGNRSAGEVPFITMDKHRPETLRCSGAAQHLRSTCAACVVSPSLARSLLIQ